MVIFGPGRWVETGYELVFDQELFNGQPVGFTRAEGAFEEFSYSLPFFCWLLGERGFGQKEASAAEARRRQPAAQTEGATAVVEAVRGVNGSCWPSGVRAASKPNQRISPNWKGDRSMNIAA